MVIDYTQVQKNATGNLHILYQIKVDFFDKSGVVRVLAYVYGYTLHISTSKCNT